MTNSYLAAISCQMDAIPADFSEVPPDQGVFQLVLANPVTAHEPFRDPESLRDRVVVVKRGKATFASIALRAQAAGAAGVLVVNHVPVWPYLMRDSKDEVQAAGGLKTFIVIVQQEPGEALLKALEAERDAATVKLSVSAMENECIICMNVRKRRPPSNCRSASKLC